MAWFAQALEIVFFVSASRFPGGDVVNNSRELAAWYVVPTFRVSTYTEWVSCQDGGPENLYPQAGVIELLMFLGIIGGALLAGCFVLPTVARCHHLG